MGEAAAAVVAGALSLQDAVRVICRRSALMTRISGSGAMASVELPAQHVLSELAARGIKDVVISVIASPKSTVVGGTTERIRELVADWEQRDIMAREVAVDVASHTPQVDPILDDLVQALADLEPAEPKIPYYSATLYDPRELADYDAYYWADNLRHAVRFAQGRGLGDDEGLGHTAVVRQGDVPVADAGLAGGHRSRHGQAQARWGAGCRGHLDVLVGPSFGRVQSELGVGRPQGLENRLLGRQARPE